MWTDKQEAVLAELRGRKVGVLGLGLRSGVPLIRFLHEQGCRVVACDQKTASELASVLAELEDIPLELHLGPDYLGHLTGCDWLFRTPFMRPDLPELAALVAEGARLSSEIELVFALASAPITGITGSDGKTTTTTLISEMLKADDRQVFLGGNIGNSLILDVLDISPQAEIVLELSSFQLMTLCASPQAAVVTNLSPNHLDYHSSFAEYAQAKTALLRQQKEGDLAVLNWDDGGVKEWASLTAGRVLYFSRREEVSRGAFLRGGNLVIRLQDQEEILCRADEMRLLGEHNTENMLAAAALARAKGVALSAIKQVALNFKGVEHRLEPVRQLAGVHYYNDSIASSPTRTIAGLKALPYPVILIAGGYDKNIPFEPLAIVVAERVKALTLVGATAAKIRQAVETEMARQGVVFPMEEYSSLEEALRWSQKLAVPGDAVVLSPACASFDMYKDFEHRGRFFKELVQSLV